MKYVIDTDILIYFLKNEPKVVRKFNEVDANLISTTIINYTELLFGAFNSSRVEKNLSKIRPFLDTLRIVRFDKQSGEVFARVKTDLRKKGKTLPDMDLMIASICITNNYVLVSNNTRHFQRIDELRIENWS